ATFDGNHHVIRNWTAVSPPGSFSDFGFIGFLGYQAEVRDLTLVSPTITGQSDHVGAIVGRGNGARIVRCQVVGGSLSTTGIWLLGGVVGNCVGGTQVIESWSSASVTAASYTYGAGGVAGGSGNGSDTCVIHDSYSLGSVTGAYFPGGVLGAMGGGGSYA